MKKPQIPAAVIVEEEQLSEPFSRTPEENVHDPSQEMQDSLSDVGLTENGQCVVQENGKAELLSRQESQTQTF